MKRKYLLLLTIPLLCGCPVTPFNPIHSGGGDPINSDGGDPAKDDDKPVQGSVFENQDRLYNAFWNYSGNIAIELTFTNKAIYNFAQYGDGQAGFNKNEMYHPCTCKVTIDGVSQTYNNVGARMKGNTSRNSSFVDENGNFNKNGPLAHFKLSFATTFNKASTNDYYTETFASDEARDARKDRRLGEMKKIDFKWNKNYDGTFTKEAYADYCLNQEGIIAQKTNLVKFTVKSENDSFTTTYLALEPIDKPMLKRNMSKKEAGGDLYKCTWPADLYNSDDIGEETAEHCPKYQIKTNEDTTDHSALKNFLNIVNEKGDAATAKTKLSVVMDLDYFAKYSAMMWIIGNPDDFRMNRNNTYLYFNGVSGKFIPIPYDNDRCFGILKDWEKNTSDIPCTTTKDVERNWIENKLIWRTLINENDQGVNYSNDYPVIEEVQQAYRAYCVEFANKYLLEAKFEAFTNEFLYADKDYSSGGANNMTFETYATNKLNTLK